MRKFFDRLRRWLIKKLGGYAEQFTPLPRQIIRQVDVQTQEFQAQISIEAPTREMTIDFERYCKRRVTEKLVEYLEESAYIRWENVFNPVAQRVDVRATLYMVNAEYMKPAITGNGVNHEH